MGLVAGLIVGTIRMGLEWSRPPVPCGSPEESDVFTVVANVHYLHFAIILFMCTFVVQVCGSVVTKPRDPEKVTQFRNIYIQANGNLHVIIIMIVFIMINLLNHKIIRTYLLLDLTINVSFDVEQSSYMYFDPQCEY